MVAEVKVGQKYRRVGVWAMTVPGEDICKVNMVNSNKVSYTYESGRSDSISKGRFYSSEQDYEESGNGLVGFVLIPEVAGHKVKVGQVWKWYSYQDVTFKVLSVDGGKAKISYNTEPPTVRTHPLSYWDESAVLVKDVEESVEADAVNHPSHYTSDPSGIECIQITRHRNFNIGNAIKYLWRAGLKEDASLDNLEKEIQDLEKAVFYIQDEIKRKREQ